VQDKQLAERDPVDWARVKKHAIGGGILGGLWGGLFGALAVGATYAFATYGEEKTEEVKTDLRGSYLGTFLGGLVGWFLGYTLPVMITTTGAAMADATLHQMNRQEKHAQRYEAYKQLTTGQRPTELERLLKTTEQRIIYERLGYILSE
jgi:membrane protein YqaA with SNARE-associated domain